MSEEIIVLKGKKFALTISYHMFDLQYTLYLDI
jgi:hypothetical protein